MLYGDIGLSNVVLGIIMEEAVICLGMIQALLDLLGTKVPHPDEPDKLKWNSAQVDHFQ